MRHLVAKHQRKQVRMVLHTIRLELAASSLAQEITDQSGSVIRLGEVINKSKYSAAGYLGKSASVILPFSRHG